MLGAVNDKSTLENWIRISKTGNLGKIGKAKRPLTELKIRTAHKRTHQTYGPERFQRDLADNGITGSSKFGMRASMSRNRGLL
jgi:hypothetical protein